MRKIISIIVPVYQVGPYLKDCIESVLSQSYTDWELLLVDDGSTDGGEIICDEYADRDSRIRAYHQENAGLSAARNTGLNNMTGRYISFLDADDVLLDKDCLKTMLNCLENTQVQVCVCRTVHFYGRIPTEPLKPAFDEIRILSGRDMFFPLPFDRNGYYYAAVTARLFRKECFDGLRFPLDRISEDDAIAAKLLYPLERIAFIGDNLYGYRMRDESITHSTSRVRYYIDTMKNYEDRLSFFMLKDEDDIVCRVEQNIKACQLRFLCFIKDKNILLDIPEDKRPDPEKLLLSCSRRSMREGLKELDPDLSSVCADVFIAMELKCARLIFALILYFLKIGEKPHYSIIEPYMDRIIDMAEEENLAVLVTLALRTYDELQDDKREKFSDYEHQAIRTSLITMHYNARNKASDILSLYPHPWYRDLSDIIFDECAPDTALHMMERRIDDPDPSRPLHLSALLDIVMMMKTEKSDAPDGAISRLCYKLLRCNILYADLTADETRVLTAIFKQEKNPERNN